MNIAALLEELHQILICADVCQDSHLHLAVVGFQQDVSEVGRKPSGWAIDEDMPKRCTLVEQQRHRAR